MKTRYSIDGIDFLRVIAAACVYLFHSLILDQMVGVDLGRLTVLFYLPAWAGVWIFVALSGYLAGKGFCRGRYETTCKGIVSYWWKRICKILIPTVCLITVMVIFLDPLYFVNHPDKLRDIVLLRFDENNTWFVFMVMWLYFLAPVIAVLLNRIRAASRGGTILRIAFFLTVTAGFLFRVWTYFAAYDWMTQVYMEPVGNIDIFICGMICGYFPKANLPDKKIAFRKRGAAILLLLLILCNCYICFGTYTGGGVSMMVYQYLLPSVYAVVVCFYVWAFDCGKTVHVRCGFLDIRYWVSRIIGFAAGVSFEFYLIHGYLQFKLVPVFMKESTLGNHLLTTAAIGAIGLLMAWGYHRIFSNAVRRVVKGTEDMEITGEKTRVTCG